MLKRPVSTWAPKHLRACNGNVCAPVQEGQGVAGPGLADERSVEQALEILLLLKNLADHPPYFLWYLSADHVGRACVPLMADALKGGGAF